MIWMAKQKKFYSCIAMPSKSFYMHFQSQRDAAQTLASCYNWLLHTDTKNLAITSKCTYLLAILFYPVSMTETPPSTSPSDVETDNLLQST